MQTGRKDTRLYAEVSAWIDAHRDALIADIMRIVRVPSISNPDTEVPPFGQGCRDAMDEMLAIGREHGFHTENYDYYVGSIGDREHHWDNTIGLWNHLDVVPVGGGWTYAPFEPELHWPFMTGRGSQDNKGPAIGMLYVMQCLKELQIPMKHEICLFVGCDEERGMEDLPYYRDRYPCPALSMIADSGFPVCYGEKGILEGQLVSGQAFTDDIAACEGGNASNMIPDRAVLRIRHHTADYPALEALASDSERIAVSLAVCADAEPEILVTATGTGRHSAFPEGSCNAVHELLAFAARIPFLQETDRQVLRTAAQLSEGYYGSPCGIEFEDTLSGRTTCAATILAAHGGRLALTYNIRYAISDSSARIRGGIREKAAQLGCTWEEIRDSAPNYFPQEHPAVQLLTNVYNDIAGAHSSSFVMGGGTYARKLPNAFAYGIGGMEESDEDRKVRAELFGPGRGGAHEPDEGLNVRLLIEALKIYAVALVEMNDCPLVI